MEFQGDLHDKNSALPLLRWHDVKRKNSGCAGGLEV